MTSKAMRTRSEHSITEFSHEIAPAMRKQENDTRSSVEKYWDDPHQAVEIEAGVVGAILLEPKIISSLSLILSPDSFYSDRLAHIYKTMLKMWNEGERADLLTVGQRLKKDGLLDQIGGRAYIAELTQMVGSASHVEHHARIIEQNYMFRRLVMMSQSITSLSIDKGADLLETLENCNREMSEVNGVAFGRSGARHIGQIAIEAVEQAEKRSAIVTDGGVVGIPTGLEVLDRKLNGLQPLLYIVAARPSMGKTSLMVYLAKIAAMSKRSICIYSLEMSDVLLADRFLISISGVDANRYRSGTLFSEEWRKIEKARAQLSKMDIYIDPNPSVTMDYIASHSHSMRNRGKCDMILVDYLQFISSPRGGGRHPNRNEEVGLMSRRAKQVSKELSVPFLLLSQLSRETVRRKESRPQLDDLRDSGNIEQDADVVMFLHRPAYYGFATVDSPTFGSINTAGLLELIIAKQRDGSTGSVPVWHNTSMTEFKDWGSLPPPQAYPPGMKNSVDDLPF